MEEENYIQAIALQFNFAEAHNNLGITLRDLCRLEESDASYIQAIVLKPDYTEAHLHLTGIKIFNPRDGQYSRMHELFLDEDMSKNQRCHIKFGLAKAYEDLGDFKRSFQQYSKGNDRRKNFLGHYQISHDIRLFEQLKTSYPKIEQNSLESKNLSNKIKPIFIRGIPRSGTTLLEYILSSHSQVTNAGELRFVKQFGDALARGLSEVNINSIFDFRKTYLMALQNISKKKSFITDKMPQKFCYLGLICAAFPEAK